MYISFRSCLFLLIFISSVIPYTGASQSTLSSSTEKLDYKQVVNFFETENFQAAQQLAGSVLNSPKHSFLYAPDEIEDLKFFSVASGVILGDLPSVDDAMEMLKSTNRKQIHTKLAFVLGHYYFTKGLYDESLLHYELTNDLYLTDNEQVQSRFEKGVGYFSLKKFDNAAPYFKALLQEKKSIYTDNAKYYLAFISFAEGKYAQALPLFLEIQYNPTYASVVPFYLSYIYYKNGQIEKALTTGEAYLKSGYDLHQKEVLSLLASIYFNKGEPLKSVQYYEKAITLGVVLDSLQHFELGSGYHDIGKFSKSVDQLKPLSLGSNDIALNSMYILGDAYLQLNDKPNARSAFQFFISGNQKSEKMEFAKFNHAKLSLDMGFEDQAIAGLTDFLSQYPSSIHVSEAKEILLLYYARTNNYRQALEILKQFPQSSTSYQRLAPRIFFGRGIELINDLQYSTADELFLELKQFKTSPFYAPSIFWRGELAYRSEKYEQSIGLLSEFLRIRVEPLGEATIEHAWYNLGYAHFELEDYEKAMPFFEKLIASSKQISQDIRNESVLRAADCAFMEKNTTKAKTLYSQVSNSKGDGNDYASFQLALIAGINSPTEKINLLRAALQKFPSSEYIPLMTMELADTYMSEEDFEKAIVFLEKIPSLVDKDDEFIPESYLKLGIAYYNLDQSSESITQYEKLVTQFPASTQAAEALENAKAIYVDKGQIDAYQAFLESGGRSIDKLQKDSLLFQYVQTTYADGKDLPLQNALDEYLKKFPDGLFIADVLNYKAEIMAKQKKWTEAANFYTLLASKGTTKYQEKALRQSARIYFFELSDYKMALESFSQLVTLTTKSDVLLEAIRGQVRSFYFLKSWNDGAASAKALLANPAANNDDKSYADIVLGYDDQTQKKFLSSVEYFNKVAKNNRSSLGAEARYQLAYNHFQTGNLTASESACIETIEQSGSYEQWITRAYILLGDIFFKQKDYFNARATLKSVIENCSIAELRSEAEQKLMNVEQEEKSSLKKQ
ncbi:MAG: tetratricopeptide repeat protein [bacterium]